MFRENKIFPQIYSRFFFIFVKSKIIFFIFKEKREREREGEEKINSKKIILFLLKLAAAADHTLGSQPAKHPKKLLILQN